MSYRKARVRGWLGALLAASLMLSALLSATAVAAPAVTGFMVKIENVSGDSSRPGPLSPGVWATHSDPAPFFDVGQPDRGDGLAAIAEDGNPAPLSAVLPGQTGILNSGVFNTPTGGGGPAPIFPGESYDFIIAADPANPNLSVAAMLVQSNDVFFGPDEAGIALFDGGGNPLYGDVTDQISFWDVGSEVNEAPGMGPNQAPRQAAADTGPAEGVVSAFNNSTRSLPLGQGVATLSVIESGGTFSVTLTNVAASSGALSSVIAPVFYATHDNSWQLFNAGAPDLGDGLETLAEDGSPADLVASHSGAPGTGEVGAAGAGPIGDGGQFDFAVTPSMPHRYLTLAAMVVETNDAFLAFHEGGVALLDGSGAPRSAAALADDMAAMLAVWDAGTEANEVPGVGPNQAPRQAGGNTGPADPDNTVRLYADATNDLAGPGLGGFLDLQITHAGGMDFSITLTNSSDTTVYPGILTPMLWAVHDDSAALFTTGSPASAGLEMLAEDGDPGGLLAEVGALPGVSASGVANMPDGGPPGPLLPGSSYTATVTVDAAHAYLSLASMVVPSNDTFMAFGPSGLALLDGAGAPRSDGDIAADIATDMIAWDAGTEQNQAGAAGPDQAPVQSGPNTGADEGSGLVRALNDPVWSYPAAEDVLRVTITEFVPTDVALTGFGGGTTTAVWPLILAAGLVVITGVWFTRRRRIRIA